MALLCLQDALYFHRVRSRCDLATSHWMGSGLCHVLAHLHASACTVPTPSRSPDRLLLKTWFGSSIWVEPLGILRTLSQSTRSLWPLAALTTFCSDDQFSHLPPSQDHALPEGRGSLIPRVGVQQMFVKRVWLPPKLIPSFAVFVRG